jgi:hypothetical protein
MFGGRAQEERSETDSQRITQGLKPNDFAAAFSARLKPSPDTKHPGSSAASPRILFLEKWAGKRHE